MMTVAECILFSHGNPSGVDPICNINTFYLSNAIFSEVINPPFVNIPNKKLSLCHHFLKLQFCSKRLHKQGWVKFKIVGICVEFSIVAPAIPTSAYKA
mmetsp:Transcript_27297/g.36239  ORF Transcript_27297/g.36239 Transcript_27297/m.36239 type:complete len:98 (-) Transcript_27297:1466-1759(-)